MEKSKKSAGVAPRIRVGKAEWFIIFFNGPKLGAMTGKLIEKASIIVIPPMPADVANKPFTSPTQSLSFIFWLLQANQGRNCK